MTTLKVYYLLDANNEYIQHDTHKINFINSVVRGLKNEVFEMVENYKTYIMTITEFLEEMEKLNTIRKDLEMCDNMDELKNIANELDFKIKTKNIELN